MKSMQVSRAQRSLQWLLSTAVCEGAAWKPIRKQRLREEDADISALLSVYGRLRGDFASLGCLGACAAWCTGYR